MFATYSTVSRRPALTTDQIYRVAPSVFAAEAHESRGERYSFIPTSTVLDGLRREGFEVFAASQTRCRDASRREYTKHMLRLRHPDAMSLTKVGSEIPEVVLINSHDGTSAYKLMAGIYRLVCSNGLVVGNDLFTHKVRHSGNVVHDVIEGSFRVVEEIGRVAENVEEMRSLTLSKDEQQIFARAAHRVRFEEGDDRVEPDKLLMPRRYDDRKNDLWTTFNVVQENLVKGDVHYRSRGRNQTTRAINSVNENVNVNRKLWTVAENLAQIRRELAELHGVKLA